MNDIHPSPSSPSCAKVTNPAQEQCGLNGNMDGQNTWMTRQPSGIISCIDSRVGSPLQVNWASQVICGESGSELLSRENELNNAPNYSYFRMRTSTHVKKPHSKMGKSYVIQHSLRPCGMGWGGEGWNHRGEFTMIIFVDLMAVLLTQLGGDSFSWSFYTKAETAGRSI